MGGVCSLSFECVGCVLIRSPPTSPLPFFYKATTSRASYTLCCAMLCCAVLYSNCVVLCMYSCREKNSVKEIKQHNIEGKGVGGICPSPFLFHSLQKRLVARKTENVCRQTVNNIDELGTPHSRNKTGSAVVYRPWFLKRRADGDRVSIDLPQQESWSEGAGRKRLKGNDGIPVPVEDFEDEVNGCFLLFTGMLCP